MRGYYEVSNNIEIRVVTPSNRLGSDGSVNVKTDVNEKVARLSGYEQSVRTVLSNNYLEIDNLPTLEGVEIIGDKTFEDYGLSCITNSEIEDILSR